MIDLNPKEKRILKKLTSPIKIQDFLDSLPMNWGDLTLSPRRVLQKRNAHCLDGALLAATVLWLNGEKPLILDLKADGDDDHVVTVYKRNGFWGAISKTNHSSLRFRDPIYKTVRELALSYFHEYFVNHSGKKVLQSYSRPINLKRFGTKWITSEENLDYFCEIINTAKHFPIVPKKNRKLIRPADKMERSAGRLTEWA